MLTSGTQTRSRIHLHGQVKTPRSCPCVHCYSKPVCIHSHHPPALSASTELPLLPPPHRCHCTGCPVRNPRACLHSNSRSKKHPSPDAVTSLLRDLRPTLRNNPIKTWCSLHPCLYHWRPCQELYSNMQGHRRENKHQWQLGNNKIRIWEEELRRRLEICRMADKMRGRELGTNWSISLFYKVSSRKLTHGLRL